jgi:ABC-type nitrate/sulfonate/bicarbonate transport system permease component
MSARALPAVLLRVLPVLIVAGGWQVVSSAKLINPEFLPPLSTVLRAWFAIALSGELPYHAVFSLLNLGVGLVLGAGAGVLVGLLMAWYPIFNATAGTIIQMTFPIPRSALIPVMILWFGLGAGSMIAAIFSGCLLPIVVSTYNGARGVEEALTWSASSLGATRRQVLWEIILPAAIPDILTGIRGALATAFILMVTSEFLIGQRGLGYLIGFYGDSGLYPPMFAVVFTVAALGFIADRVFLHAMQRWLRWRD